MVGNAPVYQPLHPFTNRQGYAFHDGGDQKGVQMPPRISCPGPPANPVVSITPNGVTRPGPAPVQKEHHVSQSIVSPSQRILCANAFLDPYSEGTGIIPRRGSLSCSDPSSSGTARQGRVAPVRKGAGSPLGFPPLAARHNPRDTTECTCVSTRSFLTRRRQTQRKEGL